jgi:hypothetical protein
MAHIFRRYSKVIMRVIIVIMCHGKIHCAIESEYYVVKGAENKLLAEIQPVVFYFYY